jgi:ATP-dependent DNA helicase RecG
MTQNLQNIIAQGESETLELKSSFGDEVIVSLVSFANTKGGTVYIGVSDKGEIKGISVGKETIQNWLNEIKAKTQPSIIPSVDVFEENDKQVICIRVNEFPVKPLSFKGRYYKRVGNSNHQLSANEITDMNLQSLQLSWDAYPAQNTTFEDLDFTKVKKFIDKVNATGRFYLSGNPEEDLKKLKLINNEKVSNAAMLLFTKEDVIYNVHLGRFKTPSMIIDDKMLRLPLFEAVEETMKYMVSHFKFAFEITGKTTQRTEIPEYPLDAVRELVLNAIVHRDYMSPADIQIKIFDNYISFFNPGKLHQSLTIADLNTNSYPAFARNKLISEAFYLTGDIEKYGSGFLRVRKALLQYPTMKMTQIETAGGFMVTLLYTQQKTSGNQVADNVTENVTDNVTENVTESRSSRILDLMITTPSITTEQIAKTLKVTKRTILRDIEKMKIDRQIEYVGSAKGGHWKVINVEQ